MNPTVWREVECFEKRPTTPSTPATDVSTPDTKNHKDSAPSAEQPPVDAASVHRCDQRAPVVTFQHECILKPGPPGSSQEQLEVNVRQFGANSAGFVGNTSSVLWPVAKHLGRYICENYKEEAASSKRRLYACELGAGTGLVGVVCSHLTRVFEHVVLTDQTTDLCVQNRSMQGPQQQDRLSVHELVWGNSGQIAAARERYTENAGFDLVIASDVICHQEKEVMEALVKSIDALLSENGHALVAYEFRDDWWTCSTFCTLCADFFDVSTRSLEEDDEESDFILYTLRRKKNKMRDL